MPPAPGAFCRDQLLQLSMAKGRIFTTVLSGYLPFLRGEIVLARLKKTGHGRVVPSALPPHPPSGHLLPRRARVAGDRHPGDHRRSWPGPLRRGHTLVCPAKFEAATAFPGLGRSDFIFLRRWCLFAANQFVSLFGFRPSDFSRGWTAFVHPPMRESGHEC